MITAVSFKCKESNDAITIIREDVMGFLLPNVVGVTHHQVLLTENIDVLKAFKILMLESFLLLLLFIFVAVIVATSILVYC